VSISTPLVADACVRCGAPLRAAPAGIAPVTRGTLVMGRALPTRHYGSVDVFLEALSSAQPGDVLVVDNGGRVDESCVGDLTVLEAKSAGVEALVVWGLHRDTPQLVEIGLPVFSYGTNPLGPARLDPRDDEPVRIGEHVIAGGDIVVADDDGVVIVQRERAQEVLDACTAREAKEAQSRRRYAADELSLDVSNMRDELERKGLRYE
jgi:4-hydroxy-4-methyl-2-oxoglutarate aldolase